MLSWQSLWASVLFSFIQLTQMPFRTSQFSLVIFLLFLLQLSYPLLLLQEQNPTTLAGKIKRLQSVQGGTPFWIHVSSTRLYFLFKATPNRPMPTGAFPFPVKAGSHPPAAFPGLRKDALAWGHATGNKGATLRSSSEDWQPLGRVEVKVNILTNSFLPFINNKCNLNLSDLGSRKTIKLKYLETTDTTWRQNQKLWGGLVWRDRVLQRILIFLF